MLNRVVLIGRLTKDPELKYTPTGVAVTNFTLAVERNFKNAQGEKETDFFNCVIYKQLAELCANYLSKGKLASVDGRIQIRTYNDNDGKKHWITEIIGENVQFLSPKDENAGAPAQNPPAQTPYAPTQTPPPYTQPPYGAPPPQYGQPPAQQSYQQPPGAPTYQQQQGAPTYPGNYAPPGYQPQGKGQPPQGQWGAPPPQGYGQPPGQHPNMPNPNFPNQPPQGQPGAGAPGVGKFGHEVSLDDDIPF